MTDPTPTKPNGGYKSYSADSTHKTYTRGDNGGDNASETLRFDNNLKLMLAAEASGELPMLKGPPRANNAAQDLVFEGETPAMLANLKRIQQQARAMAVIKP